MVHFLRGLLHKRIPLFNFRDVPLVDNAASYPHEDSYPERRNNDGDDLHLPIFFELNPIQTQHLGLHPSPLPLSIVAQLAVHRYHLILIELHVPFVEFASRGSQIIANRRFIHFKLNLVILSFVFESTLEIFFKVDTLEKVANPNSVLFAIFNALKIVEGKIGSH